MYIVSSVVKTLEKVILMKILRTLQNRVTHELHSKKEQKNL